MAFAPTAKDKAIDISVYGGLCTLQVPQAVPNGVSPDCQDVQFAPGSVFSRACLKKHLATPLGAVPILYSKSYIDPTGIIRNFYLDSAGNFWMEIVAPLALAAVPTVIFTTVPGSFCRSTTAFGREFVAISDSFHGTEAPLQITGLPDGTVQIDRVTHDAPGAAPQIQNLILPAVALANTGGSAPTFTIAGIYPDQKVGSAFTTLNIYYSVGTPSTAPVGSPVTVSGMTGGFAVFNGSYVVISNPGPDGAITVGTYYIGSTAGSAVGTLTVNVTGTSLKRNANVVLATTGSAHGLQPGYQVQVAGVAAGVIGTSISSIAISNESAPGIATVTTSTPHGLVPGVSVSITGVQPAVVGGTISSIVRAGQIVTVVMSASTGLTPGAIVTVNAGSGSTLNGIVQVANVSTTTNTGDTFTYSQVDIDFTGPAGGTVSINWPVPDTGTPTFFQVISAPTATSFQIAVNYPDGTWATGSVTYAWDGTFYVQTIPSTTTFTYQQYGPNDTAAFASGQTATPFGQAAPGQHQMVAFFQDRQGGITSISPPVQFVVNGGQYLSVTGIPIGPPGTAARGLAFTGAQGAFFFYIPAMPQINGQIVGTATLIDDNTTTAAVLDFSDTTLFQGIGISVQGNNLANQIVLDGALGFGLYASRLVTWGQRSYIQPGGGSGGLLNMGFDGGFQGINATTIQSGNSYIIVSVGSTNFVAIGAVSNTVGIVFTATGTGTGTGVVAANPGLPLGWNAASNSGGTLANGHFGQVWSIAVTPGAARGQLSQSMYQTGIGAPIATANTQYRLRAWFLLSGVAADVVFTAAITSASTSFSSTATISGALMQHGATGSFVEAGFSAAMPAVIPSDLILTISAASSSSTVTLTVDDMFLLFASSPYFKNTYLSYAENETGFDGVSGVLGSENDSRTVMNMSTRQQELALLTQDPGGRLHVTQDNGVTEPSGWDVDERDTECGALSAFCVTQSQAGDSTASGGEEWFAWASTSGLRIYGGGPVWKISEEIQPDWTGLSSANDIARFYPGINPAAVSTIWCVNEPGQIGRPDTGRVIYLGLPMGGATAPSLIYQMDYKMLDTAEQIASADPIRIGFGGKQIATDHSRKWTRWNLAMNGGGLIYTGPNSVQLAFFAGQAFGNIYTLDSIRLTDDDYGQVFPYYVTYFCPDSVEAQDPKISNAGRLQHAYTKAFISGVGTLTVSVLVDTLITVWPLAVNRTLTTDAVFDIDGPGTALGDRLALKIATAPTTGTDNGWVMSRMKIWVRTAAHMPVRGAAR